MPKKYNISSEQIKEITETRKTIKDKTVDRRLRAVQLRGEGLSDKEISKRLETTSNMIGFRNEIFSSLERVVDRLCFTIQSISNDLIKSITLREWILSIF